MEGVLHVVEVADLEVAVHPVELLRRRASCSSPRVARRARCRTLNLPRVSVSATTPTSAAPPSSAAVDLDDEAEDVLAVQVDRPGSVNASLPVAIVFSVAGASMMNGSQRGPAKTRTPSPASPLLAVRPRNSQSRRPGGARAVLLARPRPQWRRRSRRRDPRRRPAERGRVARSVAAELAEAEAVDERVEKRAPGGAKGRVFSTRTRWPGRSGLGKAYRSVMSAIGSAIARGPEMWWDMASCCRRTQASAASSNSGARAGCFSASAASGWSSTCWKAALTR